MPIRVVCSNCAKAMRAPDALLGKRVRCPGCQQPISIPAAAPTNSAPVAKPAAQAPALPPVPATPRPVAQPRRNEPPPGEFGIAPAHEIAPLPVPLAVRNALADAAAREAPKPGFTVPNNANAKARKPVVNTGPVQPPPHNYRYFVFLLALLPLGWMLLTPAPEAPGMEVSQLDEAESPADAPLDPSELPEGLEIDENGEIEIVSMEDFLQQVIGDGKLPGAHLGAIPGCTGSMPSSRQAFFWAQ